MAPKDRKGKAPDRSTAWSKHAWDERGFWFSSRTNSAGTIEYDYRHPEESQTSQQQHATPRFPGPNIITSSEADYSNAEPLSEPLYTAQANSDYVATGHVSVNEPAYETSSTCRLADTSTYPATTSYYFSGSGSATNPQSPSPETAFSARPESSRSDASTIRDYPRAPATSSFPNVPSNSYPLPVNYDTTRITGAETLSKDFGALALSSAPSASEQAHGNSPSHQYYYSSPKFASNSAELHSEYVQVENEKQKKFWRLGRVFLALWTEPARSGLSRDTSAGAQGGPSTSSQLSDVYLNGRAFTEIRRFVVVGAGYGSSLCSPIHTYNGQATLKANLPETQQHAIIYTSPNPPDEYWYDATDGQVVQEGLSKDPIKVKSENPRPEGDLGTGSRLNYSKVYTVEHYVRVQNLGMVEKASLPTLQQNSLVKQRETLEKPRHNPPRQDDKRGKGKGKDSRDAPERERKHSRR